MGAADFFGVSPNTIEAWSRRGCPVAEKGGVGKPWCFDLHELARWRFSEQDHPTTPQVDAEEMCPADRKNWYEGEAKRLAIQETQRDLIPRADVERTVSTAFAAIAQGIRAIPDNMERRHGIAPAVAEQVEEMLFLELEALADRLAVLAPVEYEGAA